MEYILASKLLSYVNINFEKYLLCVTLFELAVESIKNNNFNKWYTNKYLIE